MKIVPTKEHKWHPFDMLQHIEDSTMCKDSKPVLDNWKMKYITLRMDMRTGNFLMREANLPNGAGGSLLKFTE